MIADVKVDKIVVGVKDSTPLNPRQRRGRHHFSQSIWGVFAGSLK